MEKFDKKTVQILMKNLVNVDVTIGGSFQEVYCDLSNAKNINDVMVAKKRLLLSISQYLPTDDLYCYFCIHTSCKDCSYGRVHGRCGIASPGNMSIWSKMIMKIRELRKVIEEEYWTGEELKEEVASNEKKR